MKLSRIFPILLAVATALLAVTALTMGSRAAASGDSAVWGDPHITIVADTSQGMAGPLAALSRGWDETFGLSSASPTWQAPDDHCSDWRLCHFLTETFKLIAFNDFVDVLGETSNAGQMGNWLAGLGVQDSASCPDDSLRALQAAARLSDPQQLADVRALLATDSAPYGNRRALAATLNALQEADIQLYQVMSDWCGGAPISPETMAFLSQATGGIALPTMAFTMYPPLTSTFSVMLQQMAAADTLASFNGSVKTGAPAQHLFPVDSGLESITVLGVEESKCCRCLTCTQPIVAMNAIEFALRTPAGQIITPGSPGVVATTAGDLVQYALTPQGPAQEGIWRVLVQGDGSYEVRVSGDGERHFGYLGRHSLPAGREVGLSAFLFDGAPTGAKQPGSKQPAAGTVTFGLLRPNGSWLRDITLEDNGQGGDEVAGDGFYYGSLTFPGPGVFLLGARGQLADGSPFLRVDPAPIRVRAFRVEPPPRQEAGAGSDVTRFFTLTNDAATPQTFELLVESSQGWTVTDTVPSSVTLAAGATGVYPVTVNVPATAPGGSMEETTLTAVSEAGLYASDRVAAETIVAASERVYLPLIRH